MKWLDVFRRTPVLTALGKFLEPKRILDAIKKTPKDPTDEIVLINDAMMEWKAAVDYFQQVSEPGMVDHAIFRINAAKCRYEYLVRRRKNAKREIGQA